MALLNEEQIQDLYLQLDNVSSTSAMQKVIQKWNEKQQPSTQFEPNWDNAPCDATSVYLQSAWFDTHMKEIYRVTICGWGRPVTPHPHAEIMAKYAEVAARRVDPWVEFQYKCNDLDDSHWIRCEMYIGFHTDYFYRHIGDNK